MAGGVSGDSKIQTNTIRASAASAAIDWSMPERARDDNGDGLIDVELPRTATRRRSGASC